MDLILSALAGYLLGSIPFGLLLVRAMGKGDLRRMGSGNIGATNALRAGGPALGAGTLLLDIGKGAAAVWLARELGGAEGALAGGAGAFLGHLYSPWLRFGGGKGVATLIGVAAGLYWPAGLANAAVWLLTALLTRFSSVAGMAGAVAAPVALAASGLVREALVAALMAALLTARHRSNLARLRAGTEPKIGAKVR